MSDQGLTGRRVLVVEDDYLIAMDMTGMLRRAGADVVGPVGSVHDALDALDEAPDIAVLDVQLADETSFPIADELARRDVPFVFATGSAGDIPAAHKAHPVCHKPLSYAVLLKTLAGELAASA